MIPATHAEIEQVYIAAELAECRSVSITSCKEKEGVTSLAIALTERYLLAGHRTLYVDLNLNNPSFTTIEFAGEETFWIEHKSSRHCFTGFPAPNNPSSKLVYKDAKYLTSQLSIWLKEYDRIVIDTSPLLNVNKGNIPAQVVAASCDYVLLSVMSSFTHKHEIKKAMHLLTNKKIQLLGTVLNSFKQPTLPDELCREIQRIKIIPQTWRDRLKKAVRSNGFLSISI